MINVNNFKPGITFKDNNDIFIVINAQHSKQGRGQASVKVKVKNLRTSTTLYKTWTGGEKVEKAHIEKKKMNFLYKNGNNYIFMDETTYEQIEILEKKLKWEANFIIEGSIVQVRLYNNEVLDIELPSNISLKVVETTDASKGNSQVNPKKDAILETNFKIEIPLFVKEGEKIIVSTETGKYVKKDSN